MSTSKVTVLEGPPRLPAFYVDKSIGAGLKLLFLDFLTVGRIFMGPAALGLDSDTINSVRSSTSAQCLLKPVNVVLSQGRKNTWIYICRQRDLILCAFQLLDGVLCQSPRSVIRKQTGLDD